MFPGCLPLLSLGAHGPLKSFHLLGELTNFNCSRIIPWSLVVDPRVAVVPVRCAVCS